MFLSRQQDIKALVRGDDFISSGDRSKLRWLCNSLQKKFETKMTTERLCQGGESVEQDRELASAKRDHV